MERSGFGKYLSRQRELRGLSTDDVARLSRIAPAAIEALETERFEAIPGRAFVLGYLRSYAGCVGLDPDEVVLRFEEWEQTAVPPRDPARARRPIRWKIAAGVVLAAVAGVLALVLMGP